MSTPPVIPSKNPADDGNVGGALNTMFRKRAMKLENKLPAIVISYDRVHNIATVRPMISMLKTNGVTVQRASIASVPVLALGGGGYTMTFPLKNGDLGWIEASDRDISLFLQSMQQSPPNTFLIHRFSQGHFVPDAFRQYTFDSADDGSSMVIQNYAGTVKVCLDPAAVRVIAPTVNITATEAINSTVGTSSMQLTPALFTVTAPAISLNQTGGGTTGAAFTGAPVVMPDAIINGVTQSTHHHGNVTNGGGVTNGPAN
jgi:hypothetical protein